MTVVALLAAVLLALTACSDGPGQVTRADLEEWLVEEGGETPEDAECVADAMLATGLSQEELRQFLRLSADSPESDWRDSPAAPVHAEVSFDCTAARIEDATG